MSLLFSNEIFNAIKSELKNASDSVQIITAYCKEPTIKELDSFIEGVEDKKLLMRFRLNDLISGSSDFSVLEYAKKNGWKVYVRFDLHAKTYIVDSKRGFIGSANLTTSGMNMNGCCNGNMEMATLVDLEGPDLKKINTLFKDAIYITDELFLKMKEQYNKVCDLKEEKHTDFRWNVEISKLFTPSIETLFSHELPDTPFVEKNRYVNFLDMIYDGDIEHLKEAFRSSNAYLWLISTLRRNNNVLYFGNLTQQLHDALITDPKPYRKDVKIMLSNLLNFIKELNIEEITIDRPNFSERITLNDD